MPWFPRALASAALVALAGLPAGARAQTAAAVVFDAPAGSRPAGPVSLGAPFGRILPSGRILAPTGVDTVVGMNALGCTLSPNGRYAIVSNDDERDAEATSSFDTVTPGGYSLAVVDTATMRVVGRYRAPATMFFAGLAALRDPADPANTLVLASGGMSGIVYAFDLDAAGQLRPDATPAIAIPAPNDPRLANAGHAFPGTIVLAPRGGRAYVVDSLGNDVVTLDPNARAVVGMPVAVGYYPFAAAFTPNGLLVANEGLMQYAKLTAPVAAPPFALPAGAIDLASSLSLLGQGADGTLASAISAAVPMDRPPDGVHEVGGAHPAGIVTMHSKPYAFVAMSNVDRIATVALGAQPRVAGGTELRLYDRGPYGTQPSALALGRDERRLYVALSGIDAIAVLDTTSPLHPHRIGLIPTGWYPTALALSRDGRYLFVTNTKGIGEDSGFTGGLGTAPDAKGHVASAALDSNTIWSTLERIDLRTVDLHRTTPLALSYLRTLAPAVPDRIVPQERLGVASSVIKHVVVVLAADKTYDALLGDLTDAGGAPYGTGDPAYVAFDAGVTPNLHALARTYALAGNFYSDAEESNAGQQFAAAGIASVFTERTLLVRGDGPDASQNQDPEDYPRAGYIFNSLGTRAMTYRDYGALLRVSGYAAGDAQALGLGGSYSLGVPALAALAGHVDLNYPGYNPAITDVRRASEFQADFDPLVKTDRMPAFTYVWLPAGGGAGPGAPALAEDVADGDRALGQIVDYLSHTPQWSSTAIFILAAAAQSTRDHVSEHRSYAIVVSPYAKRHYLGMRHLSTVSALKTEEELLGLSALSLGDALATDMSDFFTPAADVTPYVHIDAAPVPR
jgi:DNA-binding beta-propeller fold protein YncE